MKKKAPQSLQEFIKGIYRQKSILGDSKTVDLCGQKGMRFV